MAEKLKDYLDNYKGSSHADVEYVTKANYEDALNWHLLEIEKLLGGSGEIPDDFAYIDKLNWHLLTIEELLKNGGGGGEGLKERVEKLETDNALWVLDTLNLNVTETLDADKLAVLTDDASHIAIWVSNASLCFRFYGEDSSNYYFTAERKDVNSYYYSISITKDGGVASLTRDSHYYLGQVSREGGSIPSSSAVFPLLSNYTAMATRVKVRDTASSYLYMLLKQETIDNVVHDILVTPQYSDNDQLKYLYLDINTETGAYTVEEKTAGGGSSADLLVKTTYAELVAARNAGQLVPGVSYQITDYQTTTTQKGTSAATNKFDIIVKADTSNSLNDVAQATHHESDESGYVDYFANCDLNAWELKYSLDNDTNIFAWADSTNGRGVIYYMKDEWGNECPYDFKNIKRSDGYYTFDCSISGVRTDASLDGKTSGCYNNIIRPYVDSSSKKQTLPQIVFYAVSSATLNSYANFFDYDCHGITGLTNCVGNKFGVGCHAITLNSQCKRNIFGAGNYNNGLSSYCSDNTFGRGVHDITGESNVISNIFGEECNSIQLGTGSTRNTFGPGCFRISLGNYAHRNSFGGDCQSIYFKKDSTGPLINYCQDNIFDSNCRLIYFWSTNTTASASSWLQNVHVHTLKDPGDGTIRSIEVPNRNLPYELDYYLDENSDLVSYINNQSSGGGGATLYQHVVELNSYWKIEIISSKNTALTEADIASYLYNGGYVSDTTAKPIMRKSSSTPGWAVVKALNTVIEQMWPLAYSSDSTHVMINAGSNQLTWNGSSWSENKAYSWQALSSITDSYFAI